MRIVGFIIAASMAIAVLRFLVILAAIACLGALIAGLFTRPKETLGAIILLALTGLLRG